MMNKLLLSGQKIIDSPIEELLPDAALAAGNRGARYSTWGSEGRASYKSTAVPHCLYTDGRVG
jgi:hypothetical protein